jgi:RNA polymerase sigma-70 factor, ECF subfamily
MKTSSCGHKFSTTYRVSGSAIETDPEAFEYVYRTYRCYVRQICLRILRDPAEAEDAMQDVFVRLIQKAHTFRGDAAFSTWLYRMTTNIALMRVRKNKIKWSVLTEFSDPAGAPLPEPYITPSAYERDIVNRLELTAAIHVLPQGCKAALLMHDVEGYRHREIAGICGFTVGNSKSQLCRARMRLRKYLSK